jgi:hypothetical protein
MNRRITSLLRSRGYSSNSHFNFHFKDDPESDDSGGAGDNGSSDDQQTDDSDDADDSGNDNTDSDDTSTSDADNVKLLREVMKKKEKIGDLTKELGNIKDSLKKYEGIDLDEVRKLIKDKKDVETQKLEDKGEFDRVKSLMIEENDKDKKALKEKIAELEDKLSSKDSKIDKLTIGHEFDGSKFINGELSLTPSKTRIIYGGHFETIEGEIVGFDKPKGASDRTPLVDSTGNNLNFDTALRKIVGSDPDKDTILLSKTKSGSSSQRSTIDSGVSTSNSGMSGLDLISAGLKNK